MVNVFSSGADCLPETQPFPRNTVSSGIGNSATKNAICQRYAHFLF